MTARISRFLLFAAFGLMTILAPLVPHAPGADRVPPDLLYCVVMIWVLRAPAAAPLWAVVALGLLADALLMRPPGLGTLGLVLASEAGRARTPMPGGFGFLVEWLAVSGLFAVLTLATQAVLHLTLAPGADWSAALTLIILTALSYGPLAVALGWLLRLTGPRRPTPRGALA